MNLTSKQSQGWRMNFTMVLHQKHVVHEHFCTESWEVMLATQRRPLRVHTPKVIFMAQTVGWQWGVLPCKPIPSEMTTWDMEHMLDAQSFEVSQVWREVVTQDVLFNDIDFHVRVNEWKYINNLMDVWDKGNSPRMQHYFKYLLQNFQFMIITYIICTHWQMVDHNVGLA